MSSHEFIYSWKKLKSRRKWEGFPTFSRSSKFAAVDEDEFSVDSAHCMHGCAHACKHACIYVPPRTTHYLITHNRPDRWCIPMRSAFLSISSKSLFSLCRDLVQARSTKNASWTCHLSRLDFHESSEKFKFESRKRLRLFTEFMVLSEPFSIFIQKRNKMSFKIVHCSQKCICLSGLEDSIFRIMRTMGLRATFGAVGTRKWIYKEVPVCAGWDNFLHVSDDKHDLRKQRGSFLVLILKFPHRGVPDFLLHLIKSLVKENEECFMLLENSQVL